ncbi:MAG: DUF2844 domain-containing protein [Candidatus Sulfotelmatobacter sp.]
MKIYSKSTKSAKSSLSWRMAVALLAMGLPLPALGALGASLNSVTDDQVHLKATITITAAGTYTIHEMTAPTGTVVREYVSRSGRVFGVTWKGPFIPDLRQLLGTYFEHYLEAAKREREGHVGRAPLDIHEPGLVVQTAGHMRAYYGRAYDPGSLPAGVSDHDMR